LSNYNVTSHNGTLTISQAAASVRLDSLAQTFDGSDKYATATTTPPV